MKKFKNSYCIIRKDLKVEQVNVPIKYKGDTIFIHGNARGWRYRYTNNDNIFEIYFDKTWCKAESIDFDFINIE